MTPAAPELELSPGALLLMVAVKSAPFPVAVACARTLVLPLFRHPRPRRDLSCSCHPPRDCPCSCGSCLRCDRPHPHGSHLRCDCPRGSRLRCDVLFVATFVI